MDLFVDEVLESKFDLDKGIYKLEEKLIEDSDSIKDNHLIAYRMCRQSAFIIWSEELKKAITLLLKSRKKYRDNTWGGSQPLWAELDDTDYNDIKKMIRVISMHNIWKTKQNQELLSALGTTKQSDWKEMLLNGKLPGREEKLFEPLTDMLIYQTAITMN